VRADQTQLANVIRTIAQAEIEELASDPVSVSNQVTAYIVNHRARLRQEAELVLSGAKQ
jgi:hypothetical protein